MDILSLIIFLSFAYALVGTMIWGSFQYNSDDETISKSVLWLLWLIAWIIKTIARTLWISLKELFEYIIKS